MIQPIRSVSKTAVTTKFLLLSCLLSLGWAACSSAKNARSQAANGTPAEPTSTTEYLCNRTLKLYIKNGIVASASGEEKESNNPVELILAPGDGQMTMTEVKKAKSGKTAMKVESCNLSAGMRNGEAVYSTKSDHELENGDTVVTTTYVKLEAVNGVVNIFVSSPGKPGGLKAVVDSWEVMD